MLKAINDAINSLKKLGVHSSIAKKTLFSLIQKNKISQTIESLQKSIEKIKICTICKNVCENDICDICSDKTRNKSLLLIVENISDLMSIEYSKSYQGLYHVLSPNFFHDNTEEEIADIQNKINQNNIKEIIIATNTNLNGEIVSHILTQYLNSHITISRIAHGIPFGQEINNLDSATIFSSISSRKVINSNQKNKDSNR